MPYIVKTGEKSIAVATLEADHTALVLFGVRPGYHDTLTDEQAEVVSALARLPESGGTVGPLPDGSLIEVERVGWEELKMLLRRARWVFTARMTDAELLDAFNAGQS